MADLVSGAKMAFGMYMEVIHCCECGIPFAMPDQRLRDMRTSGADFLCPNGHKQSWRSALQKEVAEAKAQSLRMGNERDQEKASNKRWAAVNASLHKDVDALKQQVTALQKQLGEKDAKHVLLLADNEGLREEIVRLRTPKLLADGTPKSKIVNPPNARETTLAYLLANPDKGCKDAAAVLNVSQQLVAGVMAGIKKTREKHRLKLPPADK